MKKEVGKSKKDKQKKKSVTEVHITSPVTDGMLSQQLQALEEQNKVCITQSFTWFLVI